MVRAQLVLHTLVPQPAGEKGCPLHNSIAFEPGPPTRWTFSTRWNQGLFVPHAQTAFDFYARLYSRSPLPRISSLHSWKVHTTNWNLAASVKMSSVSLRAAVSWTNINQDKFTPNPSPPLQKSTSTRRLLKKHGTPCTTTLWNILRRWALPNCQKKKWGQSESTWQSERGGTFRGLINGICYWGNQSSLPRTVRPLKPKSTSSV